MTRTWTRALSRMSDGISEARYEAVVALSRSSLCLASALTLLLQSRTHAGLGLPGLVNLGLAVGSIGAGLALTRSRSADQARLYGRWSTAADVLMYAGYSLAFSSRPGAGGLYGVFVLMIGPVRYGLRGLLVTVLPVAAIATAFPQPDLTGATLPPGQVLGLCLAFALPAVAVRALIMRGTARLHQAEQQFSTAFEHASIGMALTDHDLRLLQVNRSLGVLLGTSPQELVGQSLSGSIDRLDRDRLQTALRQLSQSSPSTRLEVRLRRPDGGLRWGHIAASLLTGASGVAPRLVIQVENITERKRSEAMLTHAAAHDALTDLPNRSMLLARLDLALHQGEQVGVLFLDLDRFKVVNDGLGHAAGDLVLVQVAGRLRDVMRPEDLVARLGGDEFVVLCRNADLQIAQLVASRVLAVLARPLPIPTGGEHVVGGSMGIALGGPGDSAELVLRDADTAMYAAKAAGGGRSHVFNPGLREAVVRTHELEVDLRAAVRGGKLEVAYQPIFHLGHGRVLGCEALVRWNDPRRGRVSPQEFVGVAEQSDLILELGEWVLRQALLDVRTWPEPPSGVPFSVSVNVSVRQLVAPGFAALVARCLEESGVTPGQLCLEVTETVFADDVRPIVEVLEALRVVGTKLSIDDFGTGHASLTYLARFPVDQVKVDRTFVAGLGLDAGSAAIVGGVVAMAHTFDLRVVAEGVETQEQLEALRRMGCDATQGYLLAVPMSNQELQFLLRRDASTGLVPEPRRAKEGEGPVAQDPTRDELRRFRLLIEGARQVTGGDDLETVLEHAFHVLRQAVAFEGGAIMLVEDDQVRIAAGLPTPTAEAFAARIPLGQGVSGTIAVTGEPRYLPDITIASTVTAGRRSKNTSTGVRSWYGVPLIAGGRPIGLLQVDSTTVDAFDESDRLSVLAFAPIVTLAVESARRRHRMLHSSGGGSA